jgi:alpha-mannosidase
MDERIIRTKLDFIRRRATAQCWPITGWQARTTDHLAPGEYRYDGDWSAISGESQWPAGKTLFLRTAADTPASGNLFIQFDAQALEGMLSVNGRPFTGVDANHLRIAVPAQQHLELAAEFMCVSDSLSRPERRSEKARLREVAFVEIDAEIEALYYDLWFTWDAAKQARDERRRQRLHAALEQALLAIDVTAPQDAFCADVSHARALLRNAIAAIAPDPEGGRIFLTGHSHIDTAWLWPLRETVRKCGRTFSTACRQMERYPDYRFSCSQPQLYAYTKQHFPELYEEIKGWVRAGRWECTGGMWIEADCNVPSGEALVRQVLHGVRFFREEFGARPRACWLPDVFGYPGSMPQILKGCGLDYFYTNKLHWQARNPFPAHLFWWEGIDGTRVLAHIPRLKSYYNGWPNPEELNVAWDNFSQKAIYAETMFPFGFGDGGGGPTDAMLEFAARAAHFPAVPQARQGVEEDYFDDVVAASPALPAWVGELYLETHRGTYTTQGAIKRANRKNELLLRDAEILASLANISGASIDMARLLPAWENLLLLQFHDILPGSSIAEVYREGLADHAAIAAVAGAVRDEATRALAPRGDITVFNTLSWARSDVAAATIPAPQTAIELVGADGKAIPCQVVSSTNGQAEIVFGPQAVPALGQASFTIRPAAIAPDLPIRASAHHIENRFFALDLDASGNITRIYDKRYKREVVPVGQTANRLQLFQDGPEPEAAWNVHATFERREYVWDEAQVEVVECGPVRAVVRVTRRYRDSRVEQDVIVYDGVPRIDFVTRADWQARQVMLKAAFPVDVRSPHATYEVQFGAVERLTHRNTSWDQEKFEVCAHRWADLSEAGYGVSLLNDCKYGYDAQDNMLRLTLLRGAEWPDADADRGRHEFTYALLPHGGDWREGETVRRAWELNAPLVCAASPSGGAHQPGTPATFEISGPVVLEALKPADDGNGWIARFYEPHGGRGPVSVRAPRALASVTTCNLVEENGEELPARANVFEFVVKPFEIRTFRLVFA